jgi:hypothetical protein
MKQMLWIILIIASFAGGGCFKQKPPEEVVAKVNNYQIYLSEFEEGFAASPYAARTDKLLARQEYLSSMVDRKLILQDAQKKNIDKEKEFLKSIERFWEQSLLTVAVGNKTVELSKAVKVREQDVRKIYDEMVRDGITTKAYEEIYSQIKWQAQKQVEAAKLNEWIDGLRKGSTVQINEDLLKSLK